MRNASGMRNASYRRIRWSWARLGSKQVSTFIGMHSPTPIDPRESNDSFQVSLPPSSSEHLHRCRSILWNRCRLVSPTSLYTRPSTARRHLRTRKFRCLPPRKPRPHENTTRYSSTQANSCADDRRHLIRVDRISPRQDAYRCSPIREGAAGPARGSQSQASTRTLTSLSFISCNRNEKLGTFISPTRSRTPKSQPATIIARPRRTTSQVNQEVKSSQKSPPVRLRGARRGWQGC